MNKAATSKRPAWKIILQLVRYEPARWSGHLSTQIIFMLLMQCQAFAIYTFFNLLTGATSAWSVWGLILLLYATRVVRESCRYLGVDLQTPFLAHCTALLRRNLLHFIFHRPGAQALPSSPGEALSRFMGDTNQIADFALWMNMVISWAIYSVIAVVVMISISPLITVVAVLPFILVTLIASIAARRIEHYHRLTRQWTGNVTGFLGEVLGSIQAVQVAGAEQSILQHFATLNHERQKTALKEHLFNALLQSVTTNSTNVATGLILLLSGSLIQAHTFTVGDFALFIYYLDQFSYFISLVTTAVARYRQLSVSIERIDLLMTGAPAAALIEPVAVPLRNFVPASPLPQRTKEDRLEVLEVRNLTCLYLHTDKGVKDMALTLQRGSFTVITGPIGCGKTTFLRALLGLLPLDSGQILWNGKPIDSLAAFMTPPRVAYTAQLPRLFSETVQANLLLGLPPDETSIKEAIQAAVLEQDVIELTQGLATLIGPKGLKLSGGQLQRVAAARMFIRQPELLVFDDISSALDINTERLLWSRLLADKGKTILAVSHREAVLQQADQVISLVPSSGKIIVQ